MEKTYILKVYTTNISAITDLLKLDSSSDSDLDYWSYELIETENDESKFYELIDFYSNIRNKLITSGLVINDVAVWMLYEYNQQCNLEFSVEDLKLLIDFDLHLCISCWES